MFGLSLSVKIGGGLSAMALLCVGLFAQAQSVKSVDRAEATQLARRKSKMFLRIPMYRARSPCQRPI